MKKEVEALRAEVKELHEARPAPEKILGSMNHLSEDLLQVEFYKITETYTGLKL